jgi:hypothetical protein
MILASQLDIFAQPLSLRLFVKAGMFRAMIPT